MRHVSRTLRAALDWLFDRINLDPEIKIKYVDTKNQLADMLTKGSFTRDEWNHLLRLFNIMNFLMFSCSHFLSTKKPNTVVAKPRPVSLRSRSLSANQSPMLDSGASYSPRKCRLGWNSDLTSTEKSGRDSSENSASSSQVWHRDDKLFPSTERSGPEMNQR